MRKLNLKRFEDISDVRDYEEIATLERIDMKGDNGYTWWDNNNSSSSTDHFGQHWHSFSNFFMYKYLNYILLTICIFFISCNEINTNSFENRQVKVEKLSFFDNLYLCNFSTLDDTVYFLLMSKDINISKPTVVFLRGSGPEPLVITKNDSCYYCIIESLYYEADSSIIDKYNIVTISDPDTPPIVELDSMYDDFLYTKQDGTFYPNFLKHNNLGCYLKRTDEVIKVISKQEWAKDEKIYLLGGSQGSWVASKIAENDTLISGLGFCSANPNGRIVGYISEFQFNYTDSIINKEQRDSSISNYYKIWNEACTNNFPADFYPETWTSFSISVIDILSKLKIPVFLGYGTKDGKCAIDMEQMPIYFMQQGKTNYKMYPVEGCGHNFEPILDNKEHDFKNNKWGDVLNEYLKFMEEQVE